MARIESPLPGPVDPTGQTRPVGPRRGPARRERPADERKRQPRDEDEGAEEEEDADPASRPEDPAPGRLVDLRVEGPALAI